MSTLPWPSFWEHIPDADRGALSDVLTELLSTGVLLGAQGRGRTLYLLARDYQKEIAEYLAPLQLDLAPDPEHSLFQARPVPGECGLTARFSKAETLVLLTLWRIYDDIRLTQVTSVFLTTAQEVFEKLKLYFEAIEPPTESQLERILARLRRFRLVSLQTRSEVGRFGELSIEILPTLPRVIPFENVEAWEQQAALYREPASADSGAAIPAEDEESEP